MLEVVGEAGGRWRMLEEAGRNRYLKEARFPAKKQTSRMEALTHQASKTKLFQHCSKCS